MKSWALQDAKARLSEVVRASANEPQRITLRGEEKAFLISAGEYWRLHDSNKGKKLPRGATSLYEALRACPFELKIPRRSRDRGRDVDL
jgi:prevent-host-death family protein